MERLLSYLKQTGKQIDQSLDKFLPRLAEKPAVLNEAIRYSVFSPGKRLRPVLAMMTAKIFKVADKEILPAACALEMVHTYSLIHDDLPAMDNDDYRRGKLSCHKAFGEALAILAGDALLTLAFATISRHSEQKKAGQLVSILADAAGYAGMVGGQVLDLEAEGKANASTLSGKESSSEMVVPDYEKQVNAIHKRKTGALITSALQMGAVIAEAPADKEKALVSFGQKIGLAFQIKDDILDVEAKSEKLGKTAGKDEAAGKITYPSVLGLKKAKLLLKDTIITAKDELADFGESTLLLRLLADFIREREY